MAESMHNRLLIFRSQVARARSTFSAGLRFTNGQAPRGLFREFIPRQTPSLEEALRHVRAEIEEKGAVRMWVYRMKQQIPERVLTEAAVALLEQRVWVAGNIEAGVAALETVVRVHPRPSDFLTWQLPLLVWRRLALDIADIREMATAGNIPLLQEASEMVAHLHNTQEGNP